MTSSSNRSALQEYYRAFDCAPGAAATGRQLDRRRRVLLTGARPYGGPMPQDRRTGLGSTWLATAAE